MNHITITEKYVLCMAAVRRKLYDNELGAYLIAAMVIQMMQDGNLEITGKDKVRLNGSEPAGACDRRLYSLIEQMGKPEIPLKKILEKLCFGISNRQLYSVIDRLKESMLQKNLISMENRKGILGSKEVMLVNKSAYDSVIGEIRNAVLGDRVMTEDMVLLASLLNSTKLLKGIFTKQEKDKMKERLNEIRHTKAGKRVKAAQDAIDEMNMIIIGSFVAITAATT